MKAELQRILSNWSYSEGLEWYKAHVQGKFFLKELFSKSDDAYNAQKLRSSLNDIFRELPDEYQAPKKETPKPTGEKPLLKLPKASIEALKIPKVVEDAALSPEEMQLDEEWKPLYREAMYRRQSLTEEMSDAERKEIAFEVLNLMDEVQKIWEKKDFLRKHGSLPEFENPGLDGLSLQQMMTRRNTLRSYLSKAKKGQLKSDKIPEWEAEIQELERRIKG